MEIEKQRGISVATSVMGFNYGDYKINILDTPGHQDFAEDRKQIMKQKVVAKYEIVADLPELKKLVAEFGKIGSNLNQIARHFNSGGIHSQEMRKAIDQSVARIYEMKYEVLKMAGDFQAATGVGWLYRFFDSSF